ncbi:hypothetical protein Tco_0317232 [Tanacetum coccineum]
MQQNVDLKKVSRVLWQSFFEEAECGNTNNNDIAMKEQANQEQTLDMMSDTKKYKQQDLDRRKICGFMVMSISWLAVTTIIGFIEGLYCLVFVFDEAECDYDSSYALTWKPCQGDSRNLPDHRFRRRCYSLIPEKVRFINYMLILKLSKSIVQHQDR